MAEIRARYVGDSPDGVTVGARLEDGDLVPVTVKHGGELPQEVDGRKVTTEFRDGLLTQEGVWTSVRRDTKPATADKAGDKETK